jgi:hypothetical protein
MTFNTSTQLFIWCNMGFGDTIVMIPIINKVLKKYPNIKITVGVFKHHAYLFRHLPVEILEVDMHFMVRYIPFDNFMPDFHHSIYIWAGKRKETNNWLWKTFVDIFNMECQEKNLDYFLDYGEKWAEIQLPIYEVQVKPNSIFVENADCISGQNDFQIKLSEFAHLYPNLNFYCTKEPNAKLKNVFYNPENTLIDHQNILRKCKGFIGKGSGPSHLNYLHDLDSMPKGLFGYKLDEHKIIWDENFNYQYFDGNHDEIISFIEANYKRFTE